MAPSRRPLEHAARRSAVVALPALALFSACASAPPPEPVKPAPTHTPVVVPPAPPPPTTEPAPPPPPPEIGSAFEVDPLEPLPPGAVARCGTGRMRAASPESVAVSNTGSIFAIDHVRAGYVLRDVTKGTDIAALPAGSDAKLSPGAFFVVVPESYPSGRVTFYSVPSGDRLGEAKIPIVKPPGRPGVRALLGDYTYVRDVIFSTDGAAVVVSTSDGFAHLLDVTTQKLVKSTKLPAKSRVAGVSRHGDRAVLEHLVYDAGRFSILLSVSFQSLEGYSVLDLRTGATVRKEMFKKPPRDPLDPDASRTPEHANSRFRISPDGKKVVRYEAGSLFAVDVATGKETALTLNPPAKNPFGFGSSGLGGLGLGGSARSFEVMDSGHALVNDEILDLANGKLITTVGPGFEAVSANGKHLVTRAARVFELSSGGDLPHPGLEGPVTSMAFLPDNRLAVAAGSADIWNTDSCSRGESVTTGAAEVAVARRVATAFFSPGSPVIVDERGQRRRFTAPPGLRLSALAPDGSTVFIGAGDAYKGENRLLRMSLGDAKDRDSTRSLADPIGGLDVTPDGMSLAISTGERYGSAAATIELLSATDLATIKQRAVASPGKVLFAGSEVLLHAPEHHGISVHSASTLDERHRLLHGSCCTAVAASADGKLAAGAVDRKVIVWDIASRRVLGTLFHAHREEIKALAFSPDARFLATGSADTTVLFWDLAKLKVPALPSKVEAHVTDPAAAKAFFATTSFDYRIKADGTLESARAGSTDRPPPLKSVTRLVSSMGAHCAIAQNKVRCWGTTRGGVLGVPEQKGAKKWQAASLTTPTTVPVTDPVDVQVDSPYACALSKNGDLTCWGQIDFGAPSSPPTKVLGDVKSIVLARERACAAGKDGLVRCWDVKTPTPTPLQVKDAVSLAAGFDHLCILDKAGAVFCRGSNHQNQLGDDTGVERTDPVLVKGLPAAASVAAGLMATCATTTTGGVYCWGGIGDVELDRPTLLPALDGATAVSLDNDHVCALRGDRVDCQDFKLPE